MNTHILTSYLKKGLAYFSILTVVIGLWVGKTIISSGREKICLRIWSIWRLASFSEPALPTVPQKRASPVNTQLGTEYEISHGVHPGVGSA